MIAGTSFEGKGKVSNKFQTNAGKTCPQQIAIAYLEGLAEVSGDGGCGVGVFPNVHP